MMRALFSMLECGAARRRTMARSRSIRDRAPLVIGAACCVAVVLFSLLVAFSNAVVKERRLLRDLRADKVYLETKIGRLEEEWYRATSRDRIVALAEKELGLVTPDGPGLVVVLASAAKERRLPAWRKVLAAVGGGGGGVREALAEGPRP
ncbi:hypothetical protein KKG45_08755 [bacterium]|nr:hypothetical protein [bacterium]MBU1073323.1 hypothetical protein [bacterium]MBU1674701.1 hypothetical protein [bacterium]